VVNTQPSGESAKMCNKRCAAIRVDIGPRYLNLNNRIKRPHRALNVRRCSQSDAVCSARTHIVDEVAGSKIFPAALAKTSITDSPARLSAADKSSSR
jgi:hypothetical protein